MALLQCSRCKRDQPEKNFGPDKKKKNGKDSWCRECKKFNTDRWASKNRGRDSARALAWNKANPEKKRRNHKRHQLKQYGISLETYELMADMQGWACAICREDRALHVDHCHASGRVRGLLCNECNLALGKFRDNPASLRRAAEYLERFNGA